MLTATAVALGSGCADTSIDIGTYLDAGAVPPSFTDLDATADGDATATPTRNLCIATSCPAPYATCGTGYRCNTNLSNDPNNCGVCGKVCPTEFGYLKMTSACIDGACVPACVKESGGGRQVEFADCDGVLGDGCEINITDDANNCGACGNKCKDGVACVNGKCGCGVGQALCYGQCIDVSNDDFNCGACDNFCEPPADAGALADHMVYGCVDSKCGQPKCEDNGFGDIRYADCDGLPGNGCEAYLGYDDSLIDPQHCGSCNNACKPDQICSDTNLDSFPECSCTKPNETRCGSIEHSNLGCYDLTNDVQNCGTCFNWCYAYTAHTTAACRKGLCEFDCEPGWGDCDSDLRNGCETNLKVSDGHCGACGNHCDTQAGQPCVEGQCAMVECDGGAGPQ